MWNRCFELQIAIAQDLSLPVYLYSRNAYKDMRKMLKKYFGRLRGVIHSFDGNKEEAKMYLDYGFYIGLSGWWVGVLSFFFNFVLVLF